MNMKEMENTPKDALTDGISDAVRDIAKKRDAMNGWENEYSRKKVRGWAMVGILVSAACVALMLFIGTRDFRRPDEPVLRGGVSYDAAIDRIDSLIKAGDTAAARELIMETRREIAVDTADMFHPAVPTSSDEEIEYSRIIINDVLSRLDELENKTLKTNE